METGTRIRSAVSGGDILATRSAVQPTATGDARVIQLVDLASRQLPDWQRVLREAVATADAATVPVEAVAAAAPWFEDSLIAVGDCDTLVVAVAHSAADGEATITPVVLQSDGSWLTPVATLEPQTSEASTLVQGETDAYLAPVLVWNTQGASHLALHVTALGGTSNSVTLTGGALAEVES